MPGGVNVGTAFVEIRPQTNQFGRQLDQGVTSAATTSGRQAGGRFSRGFTGALGGLGRAVGGVVAGAALVGFLSDAVTEAQEAARVLAQTNAVIRSTGGAANVSADDIDNLASRLSDLAAVDDEVIAQGANVLLTFTRVRNEVGAGNDIFDQATASALDMSTALGMDLQSAVMLVGKALNDPVAGMTALTRAGIQFTDEQKDQIATALYFGDTLSAQKIILEELETQFGGAAEAGVTASDEWTVAMDNFKEALGERVLPAMTDLIDKGVELMAKFEEMTPAAQNLALALGGVAIAALAVTAVFGIWGLFLALVIGYFAAMYAGIRSVIGAWDEMKLAGEAAATALSIRFPEVFAILLGLARVGGLVYDVMVRIGSVTWGVLVGSVQNLARYVQLTWAQAKNLYNAASALARFVIGNLGFDGLAGAINRALGPAQSLLSTIRQLSSAGGLASAVVGAIPGLARGGSFRGGTRVGEMGPEYVYSSYGAYVASTQDSARMDLQGGGAVALDGDAIGRSVARALQGARLGFDSRGAYLAISGAGRPVERGSRGLRGSGL